jgi:hypothetical protein
MENGYRGAIVLSLVFEGATTVLLGAYLTSRPSGPLLRRRTGRLPVSNGRDR